MKKFKMIALATVSILGIGGAFAFTKPAFLNCGWTGTVQNPVQLTKGTNPGQYSCSGTSGICTYTSSALTNKCDAGTLIIN